MTPPSIAQRKERWSDTAVLRLDKEITDFLADVDFDVLLKEVGEKGDLSDKNKKILEKTIDCGTELAEKLEKALEDEIKARENKFQEKLYLNSNNLAKFSKFASSKKLAEILSK